MAFKDLIEKVTKVFPNNYEMEDDVNDEYLYDEEELEERTPVRATEEKPAYTREAGVGIASRSSIEMKVVTPTRYDAVTQIADLLLDKKTVLLNLENTNKETAKRLIDFLSGVAYALGGDVQKVADNTFAVTPNNVAVSNEAVGEEFLSASADESKYE